MYAVAFDLVVADTEKHHSKGVTQAYTEIGAVLGEHEKSGEIGRNRGQVPINSCASGAVKR